MRTKKSAVINQEIILLAATPEQVKKFILTPERILDYYPSAKACGVFDPSHSFYCSGKSGVSLLELDAEQSSDDTLVLKVTTSLKVEQPYTEQKIRDAAFFTMYEDWQVEPHNSGSRLIKTWRDIEKHRLWFMPLKTIVKRSSKAESAVLKKAWDKAAQLDCS